MNKKETESKECTSASQIQNVQYFSKVMQFSWRPPRALSRVRFVAGRQLSAAHGLARPRTLDLYRRGHDSRQVCSTWTDSCNVQRNCNTTCVCFIRGTRQGLWSVWRWPGLQRLTHHRIRKISTKIIWSSGRQMIPISTAPALRIR